MKTNIRTFFMHKLLAAHLILLCAAAYSKDSSPQALRYDGKQVRLELRAAGEMSMPGGI
ncbi:MAG: hypothetical protein ABL962_09670 [Fimbriimonadaceae bacterium]